MKAIHFLLLCALLVLASAFTIEDHEIFRLKDELEAAEGPGISFYEFLGLSPSATVDDINKAFRKKSRTLHPDKAKQSFVASRSVPPPKKKGEKKKPGVHVSKGPSQGEINKFVKEASARYSRLGVVAGLLKGPARERYDHFRQHGFPAWRGTGYYYARYRPGLGTVIFGLFLVGGGAAHWFALRISYNRQRDFMERYIKHARKMAWGDESGIQGIPGITSPAEAPPMPEESGPGPMANLNRKQKRELERREKKDKSKGKPARPDNKPQPVQTPTGEKRRVTAENGKVLIVDSIGNVFLEEEDEEGNVDEFLLDLDEIPKPTMRDTAVAKLPLYLWRKAFDPFRKDTLPVPSDEVPQTESEKQQSPAELIAPQPALQIQDLSSSQFSDNGFELVNASGVEEDAKSQGAKKRKKGKK